MTIETIVNDIKAGYITFADAVKMANKYLSLEENSKMAEMRNHYYKNYNIWKNAICVAVKENLWK